VSQIICFQPHFGGGFSLPDPGRCQVGVASQTPPHFGGSFSAVDGSTPPEERPRKHFPASVGVSRGGHRRVSRCLCLANTSPLRWGFLVEDIEGFLGVFASQTSPRSGGGLSIRDSSRTPPKWGSVNLRLALDPHTPVGVFLGVSLPLPGPAC
jgi:hypothetical protein